MERAEFKHCLRVARISFYMMDEDYSEKHIRAAETLVYHMNQSVDIERRILEMAEEIELMVKEYLK